MKKFLLVIFFCVLVVYGQDYIENNDFYICFPQYSELLEGGDGDLIKYDPRDTLDCFLIDSVVFARFDSNKAGFYLIGKPRSGGSQGSCLFAFYILDNMFKDRPKLINVFFDHWDSGGNMGQPSFTSFIFSKDEKGYLKITEYKEDYRETTTEYKFNGEKFIQEEEE